MKKFLVVVFILVLSVGCIDTKSQSSADKDQMQKTEKAMQEVNAQVGMPSIVNFQEKKILKWIYELCDNEDLICYAYLFNSYNGTIGQYLGKCLGYGIPYSAQYSNPQRLVDVTDYGIRSYRSNDSAVIGQPEPNGIFKPEGLSATWLIMIDKDGNPRPMYVEPEIIVSPFPLK